MSRTIDVTGLPPEAVEAVESVVRLLRAGATAPSGRAASVFDLFGKAATLRTGEDIARQVQEERDGWGEP